MSSFFDAAKVIKIAEKNKCMGNRLIIFFRENIRLFFRFLCIWGENKIFLAIFAQNKF